ncbi:hypothetical protein PQR67_07365 [Paraburkholderia fungorum]|uniref:hypothetical protein n=1 Tax=Paraburkholderia fungorum TaxID=134537 RepID=UPI0038BB333F
MKIVQIATGPTGNGEDHDHRLYALTDSGQVFRLQETQDAEVRVDGGPMIERAGFWTSYWKPLPALEVQAPTLRPNKTHADTDPKHLIKPR